MRANQKQLGSLPLMQGIASSCSTNRALVLLHSQKVAVPFLTDRVNKSLHKSAESTLGIGLSLPVKESSKVPTWSVGVFCSAASPKLITSTATLFFLNFFPHRINPASSCPHANPITGGTAIVHNIRVEDYRNSERAAHEGNNSWFLILIHSALQTQPAHFHGLFELHRIPVPWWD